MAKINSFFHPCKFGSKSFWVNGLWSVAISAEQHIFDERPTARKTIPAASCRGGLTGTCLSGNGGEILKNRNFESRSGGQNCDRLSELLGTGAASI
jgi:hypothetical protein